jgi:hypothetical protein
MTAGTTIGITTTYHLYHHHHIHHHDHQPTDHHLGCVALAVTAGHPEIQVAKALAASQADQVPEDHPVQEDHQAVEDHQVEAADGTADHSGHSSRIRGGSRHHRGHQVRAFDSGPGSGNWESGWG